MINPWKLFEKTGKKEKTEERKAFPAFSAYIPNFFGSKEVTVKPEYITTVYSSVRLISSVVADTPIRSTQKYQKLLENPNEFTTQFDFISNLTQDLMLHGNAFAWYNREDNELFYLPYEDVQIYITTEFKEPVKYIITYFGRSYTFWSDEIIHIKNPLTTSDSFGYKGVSPLTAHAMLLQSASGQISYVKNFFENANQLVAVIETDKKLSKESVETFQQSFKKGFGGSRNAGKTPLLHDGLKYKQLKPISPQDSDFLRNYIQSKQDIAEIFGVPASLLGIGEQKYSNAETANIAFQNYTINPILTALSQELTNKIIPSYLNEKIEFKPTPLKYASSKEKSETLSLLRNSCIITSNEARSFYDLPDIDTEQAKELKSEESKTEIGDNLQSPKDTENTNNPNSMEREIQESRSLELETEIQKLKTKNGRLEKQLQELRDNKDNNES